MIHSCRCRIFECHGGRVPLLDASHGAMWLDYTAHVTLPPTLTACQKSPRPLLYPSFDGYLACIAGFWRLSNAHGQGSLSWNHTCRPSSLKLAQHQTCAQASQQRVPYYPTTPKQLLKTSHKPRISDQNSRMPDIITKHFLSRTWGFGGQTRPRSTSDTLRRKTTGKRFADEVQHGQLIAYI